MEANTERSVDMAIKDDSINEGKEARGEKKKKPGKNNF